MGEMVMKKLSQTDFVFSGLDKKAKKHDLLSSCSVAVFFLLSAVTFMNVLYCLSECIGSIVCASPDVALRDAIRTVPIFLSFFMSLSGLMTAQSFYRNESAGILRKKAKKHAMIGIVTGAVIILYVIVMRIAGRYLSLWEGSPSPLYPLDAMIYAALFIILGVLVLRYFKAKAEKIPYLGPSRAPIQKHGRFIRSFFRTFWLMIALYGFTGFFYSLFIVDFQNGYLPYSLAHLAISLTAFLSLAVWEFFYNDLTAEKRKEVTLPLALVSLVFSILSAVFYFLALKGNLDGPANVGFGILPIAFSANVNLPILIVVAAPLIVSVTALIKGLFRLKK